MGRTPNLLRSESLRMDETAPATSLALKRKESSSPSASKRFLPNSSALQGGGSTLYAEGLQTVIGITSNGGSTALPEEPLAFAAEPERGWELGALGTSTGGSDTCPYTRAWVEGDDEDVPNLGTLPQAGWPFSRESEVFRFTLRDLRDSVSTRAKSSPLVGLTTGGPL